MRFGAREAVFLIVLLAVPLASFFLVFRPQNEEIRQAMKEIEHKRQMLDRLDEVTAKTDDLAKANKKIDQRIMLIEQRLPSQKEVDVILDRVANLALSNDLKLSKVKSGKPVEAAAYMEQPLEMQISGDFEGFYSFLLDLERLERITRMPQLNLTRAEEVNGRLEAEFTLSIYFHPGQPGEAS